MDKDIFHYLGKRPLKVSTEERAQPQPDGTAVSAIELPPAGTTGIGHNIPDPVPAPEPFNAAADLDASFDAQGWAIAAADHPVILTDATFQAASPEGGAPYDLDAVSPDDFEAAPSPDSFEAAPTFTEGDAAPLPVIGPHDATEPDPAPSEAWRPAESPWPLDPAALPWRNNPLVMAIAAGFIAIYLAWNAGGFTDNDIWFILATGREIFENGIPYVNPFALHENMGIVVQQWVPCLIAYGLYSLGGFVALGLWVGVLCALVVLSLYRLGRLLKDDRFGGEWIMLALAVAVPALLGYLSMRPHAYTMLAFCWLLFFLEKYRRSGKPGWLAGCVALVAAHVNFQMALAPFDLVIIACYCIPDVLAPLHKRGRALGVQLWLGSYKRWPVLLCLVLAAVALLVNPYGIDGALYLVDSYGVAGYKNHILEMRALTPWSKGVQGMAAVVMLVLAALAAGKRGLRSVDLPLTLLAFGVGIAAFGHSRNVWLIAFFALPLVMGAMQGWSMDFAKLPFRERRKKRKGAGMAAPNAAAAPGMVAAQAMTAIPEAPMPFVAGFAADPLLLDPATLERKARRRRNVVWGCTAAVCLGAAIATGVLLWQAAPEWSDYEKESDMAPSGLLDYLEKQGVDPQDVRMFNPFNIGGYLEWRGYKVFMDPRPELWSPAISGHDTDYYHDYVDMTGSDWTSRDFEQFFERYDFDYLIVENGTKIATYLKDFSTDYMSLLGTGDYTLWGKKGDPGTSGNTANSGNGAASSPGNGSAADDGSSAPMGNGSSASSGSSAPSGRDASAQQM